MIQTKTMKRKLRSNILIKGIKYKLLTLQQENAFKDYVREKQRGLIKEVTDQGFKDFYARWCVHTKRANDINQSNL